MCFEKFIYDDKVLKNLSKHFATGKEIPNDLQKSLVKAKNSNEGYAWTRLISFAKFDLLLHSKDYPAPEDWNCIKCQFNRDLLGLEIAKEYEFPSWAGWTHMGSGYNSSYYSYLQSEVTACSIFSAFESCGNFLDPELGMRLRKTVLAPCARKNGKVTHLFYLFFFLRFTNGDSSKDLVVDFLGKESDEQAFIKLIYN